jgi:FAD/FMN-containing dehydrogenase
MNSETETLRREFDGDIFEPGDDGYDAVSGAKLAPGRPAYVVRPATIDGVRAGVAFAADARLALAVRGGGHSFAGFGTNDDGVVIDLSRLSSVEVVDTDRRLVRVGGGATWGQVGAAIAPYGWAISAGDTKSVGVGGLTLSGGIGWKVRKYGLALDAVVAADVLIASGELVHASADENADLFWAIRGGGGGFGIVTAFDFEAQPTASVFHGTIAFPPSERFTVLQGWADYLRTAADDLTCVAEFANPFLGGPDAPLQIHVMFDGDDPRRAADAIDPIRRLGTVTSDTVEGKAYLDVLVEGATPPPGIQFVSHSGFADRHQMSDVLGILAETAGSTGSPFMSVRSVGGAVARVASDATAYAHRSAELMFATTIAGPAPVVDAARPALAAVWDTLTPHVSGAYANFLSAHTDADVAAVYPEPTYARLAAVKRRYDPELLFGGNLSVRPQ